jgi:hypothetical protein
MKYLSSIKGGGAGPRQLLLGQNPGNMPPGLHFCMWGGSMMATYMSAAVVLSKLLREIVLWQKISTSTSSTCRMEAEGDELPGPNTGHSGLPPGLTRKKSQAGCWAPPRCNLVTQLLGQKGLPHNAEYPQAPWPLPLVMELVPGQPLQVANHSKAPARLVTSLPGEEAGSRPEITSC